MRPIFVNRILSVDEAYVIQRICLSKQIHNPM